MVGFLLIVVPHWSEAASTYGMPILHVVVAACPHSLIMFVVVLMEGAPLAEDMWSTPPKFLAPSSNCGIDYGCYISFSTISASL
jgi:hypothetical protein